MAGRGAVGGAHPRDGVAASLAGARVALVHDYLVLTGGAERTFAAIARMFPEAPIYTGIYRAETTWPYFRQRNVRPLWSSRLPLDHRSYRLAVPAYAHAFERLRLEGYDLVVSSSSAFAKNAGAGAGAHVAYIHTPPRFLWPCGASSKTAPAAERLLGAALRPWLRPRDLVAAGRPRALVANSDLVRERVRRFYGREATVVHPPLGLEAPVLGSGPREGYLVVGRMTRYKGYDRAIAACAALGRPLTIVGSGQDERRLRALAGPSVRFESVVAERRLVQLYGSARALLVPGEEDWGLTPVEANACGCPVVAAARGGCLESVLNGVTGVLYDPDDPSGLENAIPRLEAMELDPWRLREHAMGFGEEAFHGGLRTVLERVMSAEG
jgi:glycosyltransferase involved in cell wall biosynthesis